ncbi:HAD family hydrolase [Rhodotorula paludigena]|uniref:HAD family hydrolase n=1 Tax=Rhodotorula paludigena TaxID=86838 RepID=UPI003171B8D2
MVYKAVVFDIGGVVVGSPVAAIGQAEKRWGLPPHWINVFISAMGEQGPFQRFERSEISQDDFYRDFGHRLSDVDKGNEAYKAYCKGARIDCPPLPTKVQIDGKELWAMMMDPALEPDEIIVTAINRLRASRRYKVAALTNNFAPEGHTPTRHRPSPPYTHPISAAELRKALRATGQEEEDAKGAGNDVLRSLFDEYVESCVEKLRKPDPRFFQVVLDRLGVKAEETIFLDDIPHNLAAAAKMGFKTIRVRHGRSREAVQELEKTLDMDLTAPLSKL